MTDFWAFINQPIYENGLARWVNRTRSNSQVMNMSDEEYDSLEQGLATKAYTGDETGLTRAEEYYLIAENLGEYEATEYLLVLRRRARR